MNLGATIRAEREKRGWSIDDLVERLGDIKGGDRSTISKIETGDRWPREAQLEAIAAAFGLRVYQLFALAEGAEAPLLPVYLEAPEAGLVQNYRAMEPEARYHLGAVAEALAKRTETPRQ